MSFWRKHKEIWVILYVPVYLLWFFGLEQMEPEHLFIVSNPLDQWIPFCEYFIVPYLLWFPYMLGGVLYFYIKERESFFPMVYSLMTGLTICLIIYTVWPNGQELRLAEYPNQNLFTELVRMLQEFDTPTNVCPSIHVFATVAVQIALCKSPFVYRHKTVYFSLLVLAVLICLSTVFLKQHSATDLFCALVLNGIIYAIFYRKRLSPLDSFSVGE